MTVSPSAMPCGTVVTPTMFLLSSLSVVPVNVLIPISTELTCLPKSSLTTMLAPEPLVPLLSNSSGSSILYPSPLEKIVTD